MTTEAELLHRTIEAHIQRRFPNSTIHVANNIDEEWLAIVDDVGYVYAIGNDDDPMQFRRTFKGPHGEGQSGFDITLTDEEWSAIVAAREEGE